MPKKKTDDKKTKKADSSNNKAQKKDDSQQQSTSHLEQLVADDTQLEIKISWKKVKPVYEKHLKQQAKQLKLKGFRKGNVPPAIAEKEIGQEKIANLALQELLPSEYAEAVKAGEHQPLTHPEFQAISLNKDNDWVLKAYFSEKPELKLTGYKKIAKKAKKQAEKELEKAEKEAETKKKEEKTKKKKTKNKDGKKEQAKPEADQAKKSDEQMTEAQKNDAVAQKIVSDLVEELKPTVPRLLIRQSAQREMENLINRLKSLNIDLDTFLKSRQMTQEQLSYQMTQSSLRQLQVELLFQAIAEKEEFKVEKKEVEEFISKNEDEGARKKMSQDESYQQYLQSVLLKQKVVDSLLAL